MSKKTTEKYKLGAKKQFDGLVTRVSEHFDLSVPTDGEEFELAIEEHNQSCQLSSILEEEAHFFQTFLRDRKIEDDYEHDFVEFKDGTHGRFINSIYEYNKQSICIAGNPVKHLRKIDAFVKRFYSEIPLAQTAAEGLTLISKAKEHLKKNNFEELAFEIANIKDKSKFVTIYLMETNWHRGRIKTEGLRTTHNQYSPEMKEKVRVELQALINEGKTKSNSYGIVGRNNKIPKGTIKDWDVRQTIIILKRK
jgi:hypothetical protein